MWEIHSVHVNMKWPTGSHMYEQESKIESLRFHKWETNVLDPQLGNVKYITQSQLQTKTTVDLQNYRRDIFFIQKTISQGIKTNLENIYLTKTM